MKQYFYSYHTYKKGVLTSFGHGEVSVDDDCPDAYEIAIKDIKDRHGGDIKPHLIAFNMIN